MTSKIFPRFLHATLLAVFAVFTAFAAFATSAEAQRAVPVNITSTPPGATVFFNDTSQRIGVTPISRARIPSGSHTLIFQLDGHNEARLPVQINSRSRNSTFTATLESFSTIAVNAGSSSANGAQVTIDGQPQGVIPVRVQVTPGRHQIRITKEGYVEFSNWVEVGGGEVLTLPVVLEEEAPDTGSLLVAGDVSGAEIYIDGTPRGTTPSVLEGIGAGPHNVEIRSQGLENFSQTVTIVAGERAVLNFQMRPAAPDGGSVRILANADGAIIRFDGEVLGDSPATRENIPPGDHIIEASAPGYEDVQQPVTIEAGRQVVVSLEMTAVAQADGILVVNSDVEGATVIVDGEPRGNAPVVIEDIAAGEHAVIVEAPGRASFRTTCRTAPGEDCRINAEMNNAPVDVIVRSNVDGARLFVDGTEIGPVPYEGQIPAGPRRIEVRADGYRDYTSQVQLVRAPEPRVFDVSLIGVDELTEEERQEALEARSERHLQAVARSGAPLDEDFAILDFSLGWPYLFEARLGIGILPWLDAGVAIRTFGRLTEFEARAKVGYRIVPQFSAGAQLRIGGGIGPTFDPTSDEEAIANATGAEADGHATNNFFFSVEALATLHFARAGNFTLWLALDFHSDRWDYNGENNDCPGLICDSDGPAVYSNPERMETQRLNSSARLMAAGGERGDYFYEGRQNMARFRVGGSLEFIVARNWNVWGSFEGVFGQDRRILGDIFGAGNNDINMYARLGMTYKFDYVGD